MFAIGEGQHFCQGSDGDIALAQVIGGKSDSSGDGILQYRALKELGKNLIVVAMESPCDIELVPDCDNYMATYGVARDWMKVASERIFGLTDVNAKPAITIPC